MRSRECADNTWAHGHHSSVRCLCGPAIMRIADRTRGTPCGDAQQQCEQQFLLVRQGWTCPFPLRATRKRSALGCTVRWCTAQPGRASLGVRAATRCTMWWSRCSADRRRYLRAPEGVLVSTSGRLQRTVLRCAVLCCARHTNRPRRIGTAVGRTRKSLPTAGRRAARAETHEAAATVSSSDCGPNAPDCEDLARQRAQPIELAAWAARVGTGRHCRRERS